jgi:small GTP-binding protein
MDVRQYQHVKFQMAEILRSAELALRSARPEHPSPYTDLFARLAEDRFNVVVAGRFNRGKTSLMNALLKRERLPVGIVPVTSAITTVAYGSDEEAFIEFQGRHIPERVALDRLPDYVSQQGNPGNARGVTMARVFMPAEILRRDFYFVDTPGLGSSIIENTETTQTFLPEADVIVLVTSYDSPLSDEEFSVVESAASSGRKLFIVLNKQDAVSVTEREEVLSHVRGQLASLHPESSPIFSVSARLALHDREASGVLRLEDELTRYLVGEKQRAFLRNMCSRIEEALAIMPDAMERRRTIRQLCGEIGVSTAASSVHARASAALFSQCEACKQVEDALFAFLSRYQYDIIANENERRSLAEHGDLCPVHLWQYETLASPLGVCAALAPRLERAAKAMRESVNHESLVVAPSTCRACRIRSDVEQRCLDDLSDDTVLCLPHTLQATGVSRNVDANKSRFRAQADALERVAEDMHRYAVKMDAGRRFLLTAEERSAAARAVTLLAGNRSLSAAQRPK